MAENYTVTTEFAEWITE